ncbi:Very-long-chain 3-oxoacyl-CoA reductase, partial [Pseudolycoriella hygida]
KKVDTSEAKFPGKPQETAKKAIVVNNNKSSVMCGTNCASKSQQKQSEYAFPAVFMSTSNKKSVDEWYIDSGIDELMHSQVRSQEMQIVTANNAKMNVAATGSFHIELIRLCVPVCESLVSVGQEQKCFCILALLISETLRAKRTKMSYCYDTFQTFAVFVVFFQLLFGVSRWIYSNIIGPHFFSSKNLIKYGSWTLVTGATDGIGKQYARLLAERGYNVILVSRTLTKLQDVAKEISESFKVETKVIAVNFTSGPEIYDQIKEQINGLEIGILVNNVGMFYPAPELFLEISERDNLIQDIIRCNVTSVPMMCSLVLPQMIERRRGLIINISSMAAHMPSPTITIYSASKAFVTKFSEDLAAEYESQGIDILAMIPGGVDTNITQVKGGAFGIPTAKQYVESALRYVGYGRKTTGFRMHSIINVIGDLMAFVAPKSTELLIKKILSSHRDRRIKEGLYKKVA